MKSSIAQFTIARQGQGASLLKFPRKELREVDSFPCDFAVGDQVLFRLTEEKGVLRVSPLGERSLCVAGKEVKSACVLNSGDCLTVGEIELRYFRRYPKAEISFYSLFLSRVAVCAVALFIVIELWSMCGLTTLMANLSVWEGDQAREIIVERLDEMRLRAKKAFACASNPLSKAILVELMDDLYQRGMYIRSYDERMRHRVRRDMMADLLRIELLLDRLLKEEDFGKTPPLDIEQAVKDIIENGT